MLSSFTREILFKEIDLVVLSDAFGNTLDHLLGSLGETESGISVHLLCILGLISWLSWINMSGPSTLLMPHSFGGDWDSFSIDTVLGQLRNVTHNNLVWVSLDEFVWLIWIWWDTTDNLGVSILELSMSSKLLSFLLVGIAVCAHLCLKISKI
jgi:hypothetical protein